MASTSVVLVDLTTNTSPSASTPFLLHLLIRLSTSPLALLCKSSYWHHSTRPHHCHHPPVTSWSNRHGRRRSASSMFTGGSASISPWRFDWLLLSGDISGNLTSKELVAGLINYSDSFTTFTPICRVNLLQNGNNVRIQLVSQLSIVSHLY